MTEFTPYKFAVVTHLHAVQEDIRDFFVYDEEYTLDFFTISYNSPKEDLKLLFQKGYEVILLFSTFGSSLLSSIGKSLVMIDQTNLDLIKALIMAREVSSSIVLSLNAEANVDIKLIERLLDVNITAVRYETIDNLKEQLHAVCRQGCDVLVGGGLSRALGQQYNTKFFPVVPNDHSVHLALEQAKGVAKAQRKDREAFANLMTLFSLFHEGVLAVDEEENILFINDKVYELLKIRKGRKSEEAIKKFYKLLYITDVLDDGVSRMEQIVPFNSNHLVVSTLPISFSPWLRGAAAILSDGSYLHSISNKLRKIEQQSAFSATVQLEDILGETESMHILKKRVQSFAASNAPVSIYGETGTGKEMIAEAIHNESPRRDRPFVALNCASLPEQLLESELFGYEEGAFTGAKRGGKQGYFELAHKGTLFLDEVGEINISTQLRLLRILETYTLVKLGGSKNIHIDIRVISASNKKLSSLVARGQFRSDLYYRLMVLQLEVPPLRHRLEDIPLLVSSRLQTSGFPENLIGQEEVQRLMGYSWPGNVRELYSFLANYTALWSHDKNTPRLFENLLESWIEQGKIFIGDFVSDDREDITLDEQLRCIKKQIVASTIRLYHGDKHKAAKHLNISYTTLWRILKKE